MGALQNLKHEKYAQEFMAGKNQKDAYKSAYPDVIDNTAKSNGSQLIRQEDVRTRCLEILEKTTGLTLTNQLENLKQLTEANRKVLVKGILKAVDDNPTRLEATKTILRLYGMLGNTTQSIVDARRVTFNISAGEVDKLSNICDRLEQLEGKARRISGKTRADER